MSTTPQTGEIVWINGRIVGRDEARVSAFDAGFQHAIGLFETMLAVRGRVFRIERHLARLAQSARDLGLTESLRTAPLAEAVEDVVARSGLSEGDGRLRIRLTLTGGDLNMLAAARSEASPPMDPTIMISVQPGTVYPEEMFQRGIAVTIAQAKSNPLNEFEGHKTLNYWWRLRALQHAGAAYAAETIVLQVTNHIAGGAVSNLFCVRDGVVLTPMARGEEEPGAIASPVLPGITRGAVLDFASDRRIELQRRLVTVADMLDADEVFLTNSSWGVLPVVRVEQKTIGTGAPGEVSRTLREAWLEAIREEP